MTTVPIHCAQCARTVETRPTARGEARLPRGWKRHRDAVWCERCWHAAYLLRAVVFPIAGPVGAEWADLRRALHGAWQDCTAVANWAVRALLTADVVRTPALARLPALPRIYLYPGAREAVPTLAPTSVTAILRSVEARYRARRYHVVWLRREAPPSYRYPTPYPVPHQAWRVVEAERGVYHLSLPIGEARWTLRLRGGAGHARQLGAVRALLAGDALPGELAIYQRGADVLAKLVMWLPRADRAARPATGTLTVHTGGEALWTYRVDQEEPRYLRADHVRRWIAAYDRRRARLADDTKAEKRPTRRRGRGIAEVRETWARKQRARLESWAHEATAMLAAYAVRQRVARVVYDDRDRSYLPHAPWAALQTHLAAKLGAAHIALEIASGDVVPDDPAALDQQD